MTDQEKVVHLRRGIRLIAKALDKYADVEDGPRGPVPNAAMKAQSALETLLSETRPRSTLARAVTGSDEYKPGDPLPKFIQP